MNFLSSFISAFCAACVFIGALFMLSPDGAMSKSVKYILTLVFILSVISAAAFTSKNTDSFEFDFEATQTDTTVLDETTARFIFERALINSGIEFEEIVVCTNKNESGSISISKVIICSDCPREQILTALSGLTENIEVVVEND